jgi:hypothetical protein
MLITTSCADTDRITAIVCSKGPTVLGDFSYTCDANGRRTRIGGSYAQADLPAAVAGNIRISRHVGPPFHQMAGRLA